MQVGLASYVSAAPAKRLHNNLTRFTYVHKNSYKNTSKATTVLVRFFMNKFLIEI